MYVVLKFEGGEIEAHGISHWGIYEDEKVVVLDDATIKWDGESWKMDGAPVEILEMVPDIRRFL